MQTVGGEQASDQWAFTTGLCDRARPKVDDVHQVKVVLFGDSCRHVCCSCGRLTCAWWSKCQQGAGERLRHSRRLGFKLGLSEFFFGILSNVVVTETQKLVHIWLAEDGAGGRRGF